MMLTTSRKPSRKTRRLAKVLANFMNWKYLNRGKMNLEDLLSFNKFAILEELKGNPAVLKVYKDGGEILRIRFNASNVKKIKMDDSPVFFIGKSPFDPILLDAVPQTKAGTKFFRKIKAKKRVFVKHKNSDIFLIFKYENTELFRIRILNVRKG